MYNPKDKKKKIDYSRTKEALRMNSLRKMFNGLPDDDTVLPDNGIAQDVFLLPREEQEKAFQQEGWQRGAPDDYGTVRSAAKGHGYPVWQKNPDADGVNRSQLVPIGNINVDGYNHKGWYGDADKALDHAGNYSSTLYIDPTSLNADYNAEKDAWESPRFYQKAWDLNDYGGSGGLTSGDIGGAILDYIGNPMVLTTGFQKVDPWYSEEKIYGDDVHEPVYDSFHKFLNDQGLKQYEYWSEERDGKPAMKSYFYGLPELVYSLKDDQEKNRIRQEASKLVDQNKLRAQAGYAHGGKYAYGGSKRPRNVGLSVPVWNPVLNTYSVGGHLYGGGSELNNNQSTSNNLDYDAANKYFDNYLWSDPQIRQDNKDFSADQVFAGIVNNPRLIDKMMATTAYQNYAKENRKKQRRKIVSTHIIKPKRQMANS